MARNYFGADPFQSGTEAFDDAYARQQGMQERITTNRAGRRLAAGDVAGAGQTFARGGMIGQARQMQADQNDAEDRTRQNSREDAADARQMDADQQRKAQAAISHMRELTGALRRVPPERRSEFVQQAIPMIRQFMGEDFAARVAALPPEQLTDENLNIFDGGLDKAEAEYTLPPGAKRMRGREVIAENPVAQRDMIVPQGSTVIGPDGKRKFTNPKTFASQRSGGGGGGARPPATPAGGFDPNSIKWGK